MEKLFRVCPVCRNFDTSKLKTIGKLRPTFNFVKNKLPVFELLECGICSTIYQTPLPGGKILHELYVDSAQFTSEAYVGEHSKAALNYYTGCASNMITRMGNPSSVKVLEIGSGLSWMCNSVKMVHPASYTVAQDITPECVNICKWVDNYIVGSVEENYGTIKREGPFDIISLTHVIEHLDYPVDFLIQLEPLLSEKGIIFITAPNQPPNWEKAGNDIEVWQKWSYNHVPAHLQYLRENSIKAISRITGLKILSYDNSHDGGSAFELMLGRMN